MYCELFGPLLSGYDSIFWDFDGVIKDSVGAKGLAYEELLPDANDELKEKILKHHLENGGLSRFEKIPTYLSWGGYTAITKTVIDSFVSEFSQTTLDLVVNSAWVGDVREYLETYAGQQIFTIITGAPQEDIEEILDRLNIRGCFHGVYGSPQSKIELLEIAKDEMRCKIRKSIFIGDSWTDYQAAQAHNLDFLLVNPSDALADHVSRTISPITDDVYFIEVSNHHEFVQ